MADTLRQRLRAGTDTEPRAVIVGTANLDTIVPGGTIPHGGTRLEPQLRYRLGGGGAITAKALGTLGMQVRLVTALSGEPHLIQGYFDPDKVEVRYEYIDGHETPGSAVGQFPDNEDGYVTNKGFVLERFDDDALKHHIRNNIGPGVAVMRSGYCHMTGIAGKPTVELYEETRDLGGITFLDMSTPGNSWRPGMLEELIDDVLPHVDVLCANRDELAMLASRENAMPDGPITIEKAGELATIVRDYGVGVVNVHMGGDGTLLLGDGLPYPLHMKAYDVEELQPDTSMWNPTGCGNFQNVGLLYCMMRGEPLARGARYGNTMAGLHMSGIKEYEYPRTEHVEEHLRRQGVLEAVS